MTCRPRASVVAFAAPLVLLTAMADAPQAPSTATVTIRGRAQTLRLSGPRKGPPVIVTSGDGGWIHLAPHVAGVLAAQGFSVVGFDARAYLSGFTTRESTLVEADVPGDYLTLVEFASAGGSRPILVGISEGAGLSVLAATRQDVKERVQGVVGAGLPDVTELGWRWRDALIYFTHAVPDEPTFRTAAVIDRVAPVPVAAIQSTHDAFVPLNVAEGVMARAKDPRRLWTIDASDHNFSDRRAEFDAALLEATRWVRAVRKEAGPNAALPLRRSPPCN